MEQIDQYVESLIFTSDVPITLRDMATCLEAIFGTTFQKEYVQTVVNRLQAKYLRDDYAFEIVGIGKGYQFLTKGTYYDVVGMLLKQKSKKNFLAQH